MPFDALNNDNFWRDISDEVAKEIAEIWKSEYGEDWRNELSSKSLMERGERNSSTAWSPAVAVRLLIVG